MRDFVHLLRLSKNFFGRSRRARRPSDCIRIAWLCRAGGAVSASAETIPYISTMTGAASQAAALINGIVNEMM